MRGGEISCGWSCCMSWKLSLPDSLLCCTIHLKVASLTCRRHLLSVCCTSGRQRPSPVDNWVWNRASLLPSRLGNGLNLANRRPMQPMRWRQRTWYASVAVCTLNSWKGSCTNCFQVIRNREAVIRCILWLSEACHANGLFDFVFRRLRQIIIFSVHKWLCLLARRTNWPATTGVSSKYREKQTQNTYETSFVYKIIFPFLYQTWQLLLVSPRKFSVWQLVTVLARRRSNNYLKYMSIIIFNCNK